jgi:hypothetical protein
MVALAEVEDRESCNPLETQETRLLVQDNTPL